MPSTGGIYNVVNVSFAVAGNGNGNGYTAAQLQISSDGGLTFSNIAGTLISLPNLPGIIIDMPVPAGTTLNISNLALRLLFSLGQSNGFDLQNQVDNIQIEAATPTPTPTPTSTPGPPIVTTNAATNVAISSARLEGTVNPRGLITSVLFQYGTTTNYGLVCASQNFHGTTTQNVAANVSGLAASRTYHFRIVATNGSGTTSGSDRTFTTRSAGGR